MTITLSGYQFEGPAIITMWKTTHGEGVYSILRGKTDGRYISHNVIYFGESGNLLEREVLDKHPKYQCWLKWAGSKSNTYISVYPMLDSNEEDRKKIVEELIKVYNPVCNQN